MPEVGLSGMMCESDNCHHLACRDGHNGEGESLKKQSLCSQFGSLADHWYERWIWLAESDYRLLKRINELFSEA